MDPDENYLTEMRVYVTECMLAATVLYKIGITVLYGHNLGSSRQLVNSKKQRMSHFSRIALLALHKVLALKSYRDKLDLSPSITGAR